MGSNTTLLGFDGSLPAFAGGVHDFFAAFDPIVGSIDLEYTII